MGRPAGSKNRAKADLSLISPERQAELAAEAKAKILLQKTKKAEADLLEELEAAELEEQGLAEEQIEIMIDFAPYADRALIDGKTYFQGRTYTVSRSVATVLMEMISKTWAHQSVVDGKSENFYRKQRTPHISPTGAVTQLPRV